MAKKTKQGQEKQPHIAWRITKVVLDLLGRVCLFLLAALGTLLLVGVVAGTIFGIKLSDYLKSDVIPNAKEFAQTLELDNASLPQTSFSADMTVSAPPLTYPKLLSELCTSSSVPLVIPTS